MNIGDADLDWTLRVEVKRTRAAQLSINRRMLVDIFKERGVFAVWNMERQKFWYVTFDDTSTVS